MTDTARLLDKFQAITLEMRSSRPYVKKKAEREFPVIVDQIRVQQDLLVGRLNDGFRWTQDNPNDPRFGEYEDVWIGLLHEYELLCDRVPVQHETIPMLLSS